MEAFHLILEWRSVRLWTSIWLRQQDPKLSSGVPEPLALIWDCNLGPGVRCLCSQSLQGVSSGAYSAWSFRETASRTECGWVFEILSSSVGPSFTGQPNSLESKWRPNAYALDSFPSVIILFSWHASGTVSYNREGWGYLLPHSY